MPTGHLFVLGYLTDISVIRSAYQKKQGRICYKQFSINQPDTVLCCNPWTSSYKVLNWTRELIMHWQAMTVCIMVQRTAPFSKICFQTWASPDDHYPDHLQLFRIFSHSRFSSSKDKPCVIKMHVHIWILVWNGLTKFSGLILLGKSDSYKVSKSSSILTT